MKRFYKEATAGVADGGGHTVLLDGRPVRTPKKAPLVLPTSALAEAVAGEWASQGEEIAASEMHLLRLANAAIDLIPEKRAEVLAATAGALGGCTRVRQCDSRPASVGNNERKHAHRCRGAVHTLMPTTMPTECR